MRGAAWIYIVVLAGLAAIALGLVVGSLARDLLAAVTHVWPS